MQTQYDRMTKDDINKAIVECDNLIDTTNRYSSAILDGTFVHPRDPAARTELLGSNGKLLHTLRDQREGLIEALARK